MDKSNAYNRKLENALDYSLKLLHSGASVEECLRLYPNQRKELKGLLDAAVGLEQAYPGYPELRPSKFYMKTNREKFLNAVENGAPPLAYEFEQTERTSSFSIRKLLTGNALLVTAAVMLFVFLAGIVYVSNSSLPGSSLYGVKRAMETVQLALAFDNESKESLRHEFSKRRAMEAELSAKAKNQTAVLGYRLENKKENSQNDTPALAKPGDISNTSEKQALNNSTPVVRGTQPAVAAQDRSVKKKKGKAVKAGSSGRKAATKATLFSIASFTISNDFINPGGSEIAINLSGASSSTFDLCLYKGSSRAYVIKHAQGKSLSFNWNGTDVNGTEIPDGEYTLVAANRSGRIASIQKHIIVTTLPAVELVEPSGEVNAANSAVRFLWSDVENVATYTLYVISESNPGQVVTLDNLASNSFQPDGELLKQLTQGSWKWRVKAVDKDGNIAISDYKHFTIKAEAAPSN